MPAFNSPFTFNQFQTSDIGWQRKEGYEPGYPLPHVLTFQSVIGAAWRTYYHGSHDDAIYHDPEYAIAMQRDPLVMSIIQERCKATVNRKWHVEVDDEHNRAHKAVADGVRKIINMIPYKRRMFSYMLEGALWAGRVGSQIKYAERPLKLPSWQNPEQDFEIFAPVPVGHQPIDGDKINYTYDGTPTVQIYNPGAVSIPGAAVTVTTQSRALALVNEWRSNYVIHAHEVRDAPFWMAYRAGSIYGVGVRHTIYWLSWLKRELLANILTYAERTGMGLRIWKYQAGNETSRREVEFAAQNQTDRTNLLLPVTMTPGSKPVEGVEFIESGSTISTLLLDILRKFDDDIERYIIGQSLSSGEGASGLGSSGIAGFVATTKDNLCEYDADNFAETLTNDLVRKIALWTYPKSLVEDANPRFAYQVAKPSPAEKLAAARQIFDMGGVLSEKSLMDDAGQPKLEDGENGLSLMALQKQQTQLQTQAAIAQAAAANQGAPGAKPGAPGANPAAEEPGEGEMGQVMKEMTGEGPEKQSRNGAPLYYDRSGRPNPARRHAAKLHAHFGDHAAAALHHYLASIHGNQEKERLHRAASAIRDNLEPNEDDYKEVGKRLFAKEGPEQYEMTPRLIEKIHSQNGQKKFQLPHEALAAEAMKRLNHGAHSKAVEVRDGMAKEAAENHFLHHPYIAAKRVAEHIRQKQSSRSPERWRAPHR